MIHRLKSSRLWIRFSLFFAIININRHFASEWFILTSMTCEAAATKSIQESEIFKNENRYQSLVGSGWYVVQQPRRIILYEWTMCHMNYNPLKEQIQHYTNIATIENMSCTIFRMTSTFIRSDTWEMLGSSWEEGKNSSRRKLLIYTDKNRICNALT